MLIHQRIAALITEELQALQQEGGLPKEIALPRVALESPRDPAHGDLACNIAMLLAKPAGQAPAALAAKLVTRLQARKEILAATVAGPGFINLKITLSLWQEEVRAMLRAGSKYADCQLGAGKIVNVEYVSANPTGPMHVGHARNAAFGDALANLLAAAGYKVVREFYVNDAGRQIETLTRSAHLRYQQALGREIGEIPAGLYPGEYLIPLGQLLASEFGDQYLDAAEAVWFVPIRDKAVPYMLERIREDLVRLNVTHDVFSSERVLVESGKVEEAIARLQADDLVYEGVLEPPKGKLPDDWESRPQLLFRSTQFGDDTDRALKKSDGSYAYFAPDLAYHYDKWQRGDGTRAADLLITVVGADHGGWVKRITAGTSAVSGGQAKLSVKLYALINLMKNGEPYRMSKRRGDFVTFSDLVEEVGPDVVRFIMLTRRHDQALDFDFAKVMEQSRDNPVFYVQYAHARSCSVLRHAAEMYAGEDLSDATLANAEIDRLSEAADLDLIKLLASWPRLLEQSAQAEEPHRIAFFLQEVAAAFHALWNKGKDASQLRFLQAEDKSATLARLALVRATALIIASGLEIMGVTPLQELRG